MKKTTLLSLLTAGAIVATSAGTYAVWDVMDATQVTGGTVTIKAGAKVTISDTLDGFGVLNGTTPTSTASFTVDATNAPAGKTKIKFTLLNGSDQPLTSNVLDYEIRDNANLVVASDGVTIPTGSTTYKVVATLRDQDTSPEADVSETVKVKVEFAD